MKHSTLTSARVVFYSGVVLYAILLAACIGLVVFSHDADVRIAGMLGLMFAVLTSVVTTPFIVHARFKLRNVAREQAVAQLLPAATLVQVVVTKPVVQQLRELTETLGVSLPRVQPRTYVTLAVDETNIRFFGGGRRPSLLLELPTTTVAEIRGASVPAGRRTLLGFALRFVATAVAPPTLLVPMYSPGIVPKPLPELVFLSCLAAMQNIIGNARAEVHPQPSQMPPRSSDERQSDMDR